MGAPDLSVAFGLPPEAALAYFRSKGYAINWDWRDVWQESQTKAFTVAGVLKLDALQAIRGSLDTTLEKGETFQGWKNKLVPELEKLGLWGRHKLLNEETGEVKTLSPWRLETIFRTNVQTAYMAARYQEQLANVAERPYWQYVAVMDGRTRHSHAEMHNQVFRYDDPIWKYIYPPNGFKCRCRVRARTEAEVKAAGLSISSSAGRLQSGEAPVWADRPPVQIVRYEHSPGQTFSPDPGWNYNAGEAWTKPFSPPPLDALPRTFPEGIALPDLPLPTIVPASRMLAADLEPEAYAKAFLAEFGATLEHPVVHVDVTGSPVVVDVNLFRAGDGSWKATKDGRGPYMRLLADAVRAPDEVWLRWEESRDAPGTYRLKRRYIKTFELDDGSSKGPQHGLSVFELGRDGWSGSTAMLAQSDRSPAARRRYIEKQRDGFLLYRK